MHDATGDKRGRMKASYQKKEVTSTESQGAYDLNMPGLQQNVQIEDRFLQPYKRMYLKQLYTRYSLVCKTEGCQQ